MAADAALAKPQSSAGGLSTAGAAPSYGYRAPQNYAQQVRVVNGRAFYQNSDTWTDSTIQSKADAKRVQIKFNSDEYFELLKKHPTVAQWMSLGNNVDVLVGDTVYSISEK